MSRRKDAVTDEVLPVVGTRACGAVGAKGGGASAPRKICDFAGGHELNRFARHMSGQIVTPDRRRGAEVPLGMIKFRPVGRFRRFAAAKSAGHGVFAMRMSRQKHPREKACILQTFLIS